MLWCCVAPGDVDYACVVISALLVRWSADDKDDENGIGRLASSYRLYSSDYGWEVNSNLISPANATEMVMCRDT